MEFIDHILVICLLVTSGTYCMHVLNRVLNSELCEKVNMFTIKFLNVIFLTSSLLKGKYFIFI